MTKFGISKTTINFKIGVFNFINQHPGMKKQSISLFYLNNNFRVTKAVCQERASEFRSYAFCLNFFLLF